MAEPVSKQRQAELDAIAAYHRLGYGAAEGNESRGWEKVDSSALVGSPRASKRAPLVFKDETGQWHQMPAGYESGLIDFPYYPPGEGLPLQGTARRQISRDIELPAPVRQAEALKGRR